MADSHPKDISELQSDFSAMMATRKKILSKVAWMFCRRKDDRNDLMQEMACGLWVSFPSFRGEAGYSTWVFSVALKTAQMYLRSKREWIEPTDEFPEAIHPSTTEDEKATDIETSLQNLRGSDKALLVMLTEGYTYGEISDVLGVPLSTLYKRVQRLRDLLKGKLTF